MLLCQCILISQNIYTYPVKPGTEEWNALKNEEERFKALQIPDSILSGMTTNELVQVCLNYPGFFHFGAFNDFQTGMFAVILRFNGLQELFLRRDAGKELVTIYSKLDTSGYNNKNLQCTEEFWPLRYIYIELLLAQEAIIYTMPESLQKQLLKISRDKMISNLNSKASNYLFDYQSTALISSRLLRKLDNAEYNNMVIENPEIEQFTNTGNLHNVHTLKSIIEHTDSFLNKNKIY